MRTGVAIAAVMFLACGAANAAPAPQLFAQRCAMCHQRAGTGLPNQFPRIAGRAASIAQSAPGRRYLALVLLNGMMGSILVDNQAINGFMPSMAGLPDGDIAAILNYVAQLAPPAKGKKPAPFTAAEIAGFRHEGSLGASAVARERAKLGAAGLLP